MDKNTLNEVENLKKKIDEEFEQKNYQQADELSLELCELQGLDDRTQMPADFFYQIRKRAKQEKRSNFKKFAAQAAAVVCILGISGGTVYAAVSHLRQMDFFAHGIVASDDTVTFDTYQKMEIYTDIPLSEDNEITVISSTEGTADQLWSKKEERQRVSQVKESDDGINWRDGESDVVNETVYTYPDYESACLDSGLDPLFTKTYEQLDDVSYIEHVSAGEMPENKMGEVIAQFRYGEGTFSVDECKVLNWEGNQRTSVAITSSAAPATNQREYTASSGKTFLLSDDMETGELRTVAFISYDAYDISIVFTGLSEDQIHEIIDSLIL